MDTASIALWAPVTVGCPWCDAPLTWPDGAVALDCDDCHVRVDLPGVRDPGADRTLDRAA